MSLKCNVLKADFINGLSALQNVTNKRGTMAILLNVLIEGTHNGLILTGTDMEVGLRLFVPAEILETGQLTIPSKKLYEIVRENGSHVINLEEKENNWIKIKGGDSVYNLAGMASEEFVSFPTYQEDGFTSFSAATFLDLIDKTSFSIAGEKENNYLLTSVLLEKEIRETGSFLKMISSDGHRLSIMEKEATVDLQDFHLNETTLISKKGIHELRSFCESRDKVEVSIEKKQMVVKDGDAVMVISLKEGEFPKYQAILDIVSLDESIQINRKKFLESLKRINLLTDDVFHTIHMQMELNRLILTSHNADFGDAKDELEINYLGEPLNLGFNCRYFIETLQVMEGNTVDAYINSSNSPFLLKSADDKGFISIIMPMKLL